MAVGTGFEKAQPALWPAERDLGPEEGEGALITDAGNRFLLGYFGFGIWFKEERPPGAELGVQWVTPDGVKSKTDKGLGFPRDLFLLSPPSDPLF